MVTRDRVTWGTRVGTGATADRWRRQGFIGSWKRSEIGFGESCRTVNIRKTTESHTVNREMSCYVNSVTSKSLEEKIKWNVTLHRGLPLAPIPYVAHHARPPPSGPRFPKVMISAPSPSSLFPIAPSSPPRRSLLSWWPLKVTPGIRR